MLNSLDTLIAFALIFTVVSLLITIVVQIITSSLNLRGKNLAWGVAEAFEVIAPELEAKVKGRGKNLADHLLKDYLLSDRQFLNLVTMAEAVRPEELFALLHSIAIGNRPGTPDDIRNDVVTLFKSLGVPASVFEQADTEKAQLEAFQSYIGNQIAVLPSGPVKNKLQQIKTDIDGKLANAEAYAADTGTRWAAQGEASIQATYQKLQQWLDIGQERSQEWFTTHTRLITAMLGLLAAFALQLDTVEIFWLVSSDREVRDNLVAESKAVIDQGENVLKNKSSILMESWKNASATYGGSQASVVLSNITAIDTTGTVKAKIRREYTNLAPDQIEAILNNFDAETEKEVKTRLQGYTEEYDSMNKSFEKTGFSLFPKDGWRWWAEPGSKSKIYSRHILGMLFSALLLSLGAPFWFNTLKSLASLRSSVAQNISDEGEAGKKTPMPGQTSEPPPTVK